MRLRGLRRREEHGRRGLVPRKNAVRLLGEHERSTGRSVPRGRRIYDEAVRQALIVAWEASGRISAARG